MSNKPPAADKGYTWVEFLQDCPPNTVGMVNDAVGFTANNTHWILSTPDIKRECESNECDGPRQFFSLDSTDLRQFQIGTRTGNVFLTYFCRNCGESQTCIAVSVWRTGSGLERSLVCVKLGERPAFGPSTPARVISLIGADRDLFLKGRRAEFQGLGIGAFGYYRRVVENQRNRLLDEIIRVGKRIGSRPDLIAALETAKRETQFSKAVNDVKDAIPEALTIRGHNPFTLLHSALSEGLHDLPDADCLALATSVRVILFQLAERIEQALKDDAEVSSALTHLLDRKQ